MTSAVLLSIRDKSTRMTSKCWAQLGNKSIVQFISERLNRPNWNLTLATSELPSDDLLVEFATSSNIPYFRGDPLDKIQRYLDCANYFDYKQLAIVDGDDPFINLSLVDTALSASADLVTFKGYELGTAPIGVSRKLLLEISNQKSSVDTEVWGLLAEEIVDPASHLVIESFTDRIENARLTVDYDEDLTMLNSLLTLLPEGIDYRNTNVIRALINNPNLREINAWRNEEYFAAIESKQAQTK